MPIHDAGFILGPPRRFDNDSAHILQFSYVRLGLNDGKPSNVAMRSLILGAMRCPAIQSLRRCIFSRSSDTANGVTLYILTLASACDLRHRSWLAKVDIQSLTPSEAIVLPVTHVQGRNRGRDDRPARRGTFYFFRKVEWQLFSLIG